MIETHNLNERKRKVNSINKSENKINKEVKEQFLHIFNKYKENKLLEEKIKGIKIENEVEYGNFSLIFNTYLNYVINKVKEYFINVEKDIEKEFLKKIYKNIIYWRDCHGYKIFNSNSFINNFNNWSNN